MKTHIQIVKNILLKESHFKPNIAQLNIIKKIIILINKNSPNLMLKNFFYEKKSGIYLYGPAGRGKSVIMKAFNRIQANKDSSLFHFNELMFKLQKIDFSNESKLLDELKKNKIFFSNQKLIFVDELEINNIADVILLKKFINIAKKIKIMILFTSNFSPENLYFNNHHKKQIIEFIEIIKNKFEIIKLNTRSDYRIKNSSLSDFLFENTKETNNNEMNILKKKIINNKSGIEKKIERPGHTFSLKKFYGDLLECDFNLICGTNLNFKDYLFLLDSINFLFIKNVPMLKKEINDKIKRFIYLIDAVYERKKILSISTLVKFDKIYLKSHNNLDFKRTYSRLNEILSKKYIIDNSPKQHKFLQLDD